MLECYTVILVVPYRLFPKVSVQNYGQILLKNQSFGSKKPELDTEFEVAIPIGLRDYFLGGIFGNHSKATESVIVFSKFPVQEMRT